MTRVHVGVAGNIEPGLHVRNALKGLQDAFHVDVQGPVYRTAPIGRPDQGEYWNTVVAIKTDLAQGPLQERLRAMEQAHGRVRTDDLYAARTLDLDILLWDGEPPDEEAAADLRERPWNQWCLHRMGDGPRPEPPEPARSG